MYYILFLSCISWEKLRKSSNTFRLVLFASWQVCWNLAGDGMGMGQGGNHFRTPMQKIKTQLKIIVLAMAHTNLFFSIRITPYQPLFELNKNTKNCFRIFQHFRVFLSNQLIKLCFHNLYVYIYILYSIDFIKLCILYFSIYCWGSHSLTTYIVISFLYGTINFVEGHTA